MSVRDSFSSSAQAFAGLVSRLPDGEWNEPALRVWNLGYLHVKDVLELLGQPPETPVPASSVRPLPEMASTASLDGALALLRCS